MGSWISKDGVLYPAKERVSLKNISGKVLTNPSAEGSKYFGEQVQPGDDFIYEGPDRAAMFLLFKEKVDTLGQDFRHNPDMIGLARQFGFKDVNAYAKSVGYDKAKVEEEFLKKASVVAKHDLPAKAKEILIMGGGQDSSGGGADIIGGFGEERVRPASEVTGE
jgi:hypothetical protein